MVDREGNIGQFRALQEVAWHIGGLSTRYIGIEHVANWKEPLTDDQINASAALIAHLAAILDFPIAAIDNPGELGIGFHKQFSNTGCGENVFCALGSSKHSLHSFEQIIDQAQDLMTITC